MTRSWSSPLGAVFLFSFLAMLTVAAPVQAGATVLSTATSQFGSPLADFSNRHVDGVDDQRSSIVAVLSESLTGLRLIMAAEPVGTRHKATFNNVPAGQPKEKQPSKGTATDSVQKKFPERAAKSGSASKQQGIAGSTTFGDPGDR